MKVLDLRCAHDHRFEGWFASENDFFAQNDAGRIECPICSNSAVVRVPSAPRLSAGSLRAFEPTVSSASPAESKLPQSASQSTAAVTLQSAWTQALQHVLANTDDVGERFAEEARRMHYGEADERAIRGRATPEQARELHDEGIDVIPLPVPPALKGRLQ